MSVLNNYLEGLRMCTPSKAKGFTLTELMIVVAVIGILGAVTTPVLLSQLPNYRLTGTARAFSSTLQYAKLSAASTGKE